MIWHAEKSFQYITHSHVCIQLQDIQYNFVCIHIHNKYSQFITKHTCNINHLCALLVLILSNQLCKVLKKIKYTHSSFSQSLLNYISGNRSEVYIIILKYNFTIHHSYVDMYPLLCVHYYGKKTLQNTVYSYSNYLPVCIKNIIVIRFHNSLA